MTRTSLGWPSVAQGWHYRQSPCKVSWLVRLLPNNDVLLLEAPMTKLTDFLADRGPSEMYETYWSSDTLIATA